MPANITSIVSSIHQSHGACAHPQSEKCYLAAANVVGAIENSTHAAVHKSRAAIKLLVNQTLSNESGRQAGDFHMAWHRCENFMQKLGLYKNVTENSTNKKSLASFLCCVFAR